MNRNTAAKRRRLGRKLHFLAMVSILVSKTGFNGHFSNQYTVGSPIYFPSRSQKIKTKIRNKRK